MCTPAVSAEGGGGVESPTKFSKRESLGRTSTFREGLLREKRITFFRGGDVIVTYKIN